MPVLYVATFAAWSHFSDPQLNVMALVVLIWGARLTFNFARKGGCSGRRGLSLGGPASKDGQLAVPGLQRPVHRRVPEPHPGADRPPGLDGLPASIDSLRAQRCSLGDSVPRMHGR